MKKAFTMLELIFVIIVIGILAAVVMPRTASNKVAEAAVQVISHIQYTQHLAMVDDRFDPNVNWYRERWQIKFNNTVGSDNKWAYTIYSDSINRDGVPNVNEIADNPLNNGKKLTGGYSAGTIEYDDSDATNELNIGHTYSINDIDFLDGCASGDTQMWLSFDHLGRPIYRNSQLLDSVYADGGTNRLITQTCNIVLTSPEGSVTIAIEPETGYAHII